MRESPFTRLWRKRVALLTASCAAAALAGALLGKLARFELPDPERLLDETPAEMTRLVDRAGGQLASFASEKRLSLEPSEVPESFRLALIASEDSRFESHPGVDPVGVVRAMWVSLRRLRFAQGASTLSMQLAGTLFLDRSQRTPSRKFEEMLLALEIERRFTKREILTLYCNEVHFGHGLYGLEAAAQFYFAKPASALTLDESATLVGLLPRPARFSPLRDIELSRRRRDLVLGRMVDEGYVAPAEAARLASRPIVLAAARTDTAPRPARHFNEYVRRQLEERFGAEQLYRGGLVVRTTLDPRLQALAERTLADGLAALERWRGSAAEGALVALDPATGEVLALVGGRDFDLSEYDRAIQARRQPGSLFKPFVFAAALGHGFTLADVLIDEPTVFVDRQAPVPYQPENFERRYHGAITLRTALEESVNIVTVQLLEQVGPSAVIDTARRLGLEGPLEPYPSLALGAFEATLLELTSAYGAFANGGLWLEPHTIASVDDGEGRPLPLAPPIVREALDARVAALMTQALAGVVASGTAQAAGLALPDRALAGKTGTTDGFTDAWFVGYAPGLVAGVWVGHDGRESLGEGATGARAALPIWIEFMRRALEGSAGAAFPVPEGLVSVPIDRHTGLRPQASAGCEEIVVELFIAGTEPLEPCSAAHHKKLRLPYPFHRYAFDVQGALEIPRDELRLLLAQEPSVSVDRSGETLRGAGGLELPLAIIDVEAPHEPALERFGVDGRRARTVRFDD